MNASRTGNERQPTDAADAEVVSASGAARLLKVGRSTIQRRLADGSLPSAVKGADGWEIPVEALMAAQIGPRSTAGSTRPRPRTPSPRGTAGDRSALAHKLQVVQLQAEVESTRRAAAEELGAERAEFVRYLQSVVDALLQRHRAAGGGA
ncbi:helix-turn-helix domain-containing protein [Prescottella equi]|uniref:helix-turn-helix domain-containing protein n=1 Tax=Rhodococcus hoagii TaxID=43767 RepID=UPI001C7488C8|nr:helix-turn-helix domain-containing protein [Prescottella equi]BCN44712.1 hypothetical protein RE9414_29920 [Prescottella equi]